MQLFKSHYEVLNDLENYAVLYKGYFDQYLDLINKLTLINYDQNKIMMYGNEYNVPRLEAWFGDSSYTYTGLKLKPRKFPKWLVHLKHDVEQLCNSEFNSVLVNKYRNGDDYVSWHQDNEVELGTDPIIASLSFGESRVFHLRSIEDNNLKKKIQLDNGDLFLMGRGIQKNWQHQLPKDMNSKNTRFNLTFRNILKT